MRAKGAPHLHCDLATVVAEHGGASDQQHEAANRHGEAHRQGARLESAYAMPVKKSGLHLNFDTLLQHVPGRVSDTGTGCLFSSRYNIVTSVSSLYQATSISGPCHTHPRSSASCGNATRSGRRPRLTRLHSHTEDGWFDHRGDRAGQDHAGGHKSHTLLPLQ